MRRLSPLLVVAGVALLVLGLGLAGTPAALALTATPSPTLPDRPTLTPVAPTAAPTQAPTASAEPEPEGERRRPAAPGRITGTVIDLSTGAPAPGIPVAVGDTVVVSDGNGNYDRPGLPAGSYAVELRLPAGRGEPAQGAVTVALPAGGTVVQHLAFRGPQPQAATPTAGAPEAAPTAAPPPTAAPAPAATPAPTPATLPRTGGAGAQAALVLAGLALMLAGAGLSLAGRRR